MSKDHIDIDVDYSPQYSVSTMAKQIKGRSSRILQKEYNHLEKRSWVQRFWGRGFGAISRGNITDKMVQDYIEQHRKNPIKGGDNFFLD